MKSSKWRVVLSTKLVYQFVLLIALVASASPVHSDSPAVAPEASITVMSRNLYVGASFNLLVGVSTPNDISENFLEVGFQDAWSLVHPHDPGFSCCQAEDLLNPTSQLSTRIDRILFHSNWISVEDVQLVGDNPSDRIPSGQWPSDHAGIVGRLSIK